MNPLHPEIGENYSFFPEDRKPLKSQKVLSRPGAERDALRSRKSADTELAEKVYDAVHKSKMNLKIEYA